MKCLTMVVAVLLTAGPAMGWAMPAMAQTTDAVVSNSLTTAAGTFEIVVEDPYDDGTKVRIGTGALCVMPLKMRNDELERFFRLQYQPALEGFAALTDKEATQPFDLMMRKYSRDYVTARDALVAATEAATDCAFPVSYRNAMLAVLQAVEAWERHYVDYLAFGKPTP